MSNDIQTTHSRQTLLCLQQTTDKTRYLVEVHFLTTSTQSVQDRLKRVILHDLEHGKRVQRASSILQISFSFFLE